MVGFYRREGPKVRHKGTIWGMYVVPESRSLGVGRALLTAAIERASTLEGFEQVLLAVVTTKDAARNLYLSLGFQIYGKEIKAMKIGNRYFDEDLMQLDLLERSNVRIGIGTA
jgi:ribosomal protein S18 acetylase RimI-like enzyme